MKQSDIAVVMINWNGLSDSLACIEALYAQTQAHTLLAVDNNSSDDFVKILPKKYPNAVLFKNSQNLGFAGGVNTGIRYAIEQNFSYVALINNDAVPSKDWLEKLLESAEKSPKVGIATGMLLKTDQTFDSTGDHYTSWGLAYPRGRGEENTGQYNVAKEVFGASGGASLYRVAMLKEIGIFDEDFFAYYEDVDLSFRAQLAGWKVLYQPKAVALHKIGASSGKVKGFTTYQTIKNLPWLFIKNVPSGLLTTILPRFVIAYSAIVFSSLAQGKLLPVIKGLLVSAVYVPKKLAQRHHIQKKKKVSTDYIASILVYDLPPNAAKLQSLRNFLRALRFWRR